MSRSCARTMRGVRDECPSSQPAVTHFGVMEHERVVGRERDIQTALEEGVKRVAGEVQEELVVRQWGHRDPDLRDVEQVLKDGGFSELDPVVNSRCGEED